MPFLLFVVGWSFLFFVAPSLAVFSQASVFNQDVSKWNTGAVANMFASKCTLSPSLWPRLPLLCVLNIRQLEFHRITILTRSVLFAFVFLKRYSFFVVCGRFIFFFFVAPSLAVFHTASAFNSDVSKWNTGAVTNMHSSKCTLSLVYFEYMYTTTRVSPGQNVTTSQISHVLLPSTAVFLGSGFKRTLCGGQWQSFSSNNDLTSTGRLGCCPVDSFMSNPTQHPFDAETSCTSCPVSKST